MSIDEGIAYSSDKQVVLDAWVAYQEHYSDVAERRKEISERYGRGVMVSRSGFGHGTRVVGFQYLEGDKDGDVIGENGELRAPKKGPPYNTIVPNVRRQAGKDLRTEIDKLRLEAPDLPGMPQFQLMGNRSLAPALALVDGVVWARWSDDISDVRTGGSVDLEVWEQRPLSAYFAAQEAREAS